MRICELCGEPVGPGQDNHHPAQGLWATGAPESKCKDCKQPWSWVCLLGMGHWSFRCVSGHRWTSLDQ
jgi:hypothetical protein